MSVAQTETIDFIASHSADLAEMARSAKQEALAHILEMAKMEAQNVLHAATEKVKKAA